MKQSDDIILEKIIKYCNNINDLMAKYGNSYDNYINDISFRYSCDMCILQIGELAGRLSDKFTSENTDIPWRAIKGMRNIHVHDYDKVDYGIMWGVLTDRIPELEQKIIEILEQ